MDNQINRGGENGRDDLGVGAVAERSMDLSVKAEPEALLHIARLLGLRQDESGRLR